MFIELIRIMPFLLFSNTLNYYNRSFFYMADLDLTYINQTIIGYTLH